MFFNCLKINKKMKAIKERQEKNEGFILAKFWEERAKKKERAQEESSEHNYTLRKKKDIAEE